MGAPRLKIRPIAAAEAEFLRAKLADKRLSAEVHERYRIIGAVRVGATPAAASRVIGCSEGKAEWG